MYFQFGPILKKITKSLPSNFPYRVKKDSDFVKFFENETELKYLLRLSHLFLFSRYSRLGLVSLSYLWRRDQAELFDEMIDAKVEAILIKVATLGLDDKHLGLSLSQVRDHLHKMVIMIIIPPK